MIMTDGFRTTGNIECSTPQSFFDYWNNIYHFDVDVCASDENHKCNKYYTISDDGLSKEWVGNVWCNPPYGAQIHKWCEKAYESMDTATTVMLIPARTDTNWFHDWVWREGVEIVFIRGRLKFNGMKVTAPFPSIVAIYRKRYHK